MRRLIDLSHEIASGTVTYPGLPAPVVSDFLSREASHARYAPGTEFHIGKIEMIANTGTYVDSPFHRYAGGTDLAGLALEAVADVPGVVVRIPAAVRAIDAARLAGLDVRGKAVLLHTGWDRHWGAPTYLGGHPFLTRDGAERLAQAGAALVGIDSVNIDDATDGARPAHTTLLGAGIPIAEHLTNLAALPDGPFRFTAAPVKVRGMGSFPVRAFAVVEG